MPFDSFRGQGPYGDGGYGGFHRHKVSAPPQVFINERGGYGSLTPDTILYGVGIPGMIFGELNGINRVFTTAVICSRMRVFLNGLLQTGNYDVSTGPTSVVFLKIPPQPGDTIVVFGWVGWV